MKIAQSNNHELINLFKKRKECNGAKLTGIQRVTIGCIFHWHSILLTFI